MPRKKKPMKIDLRAKIIGQLLDVTGSSIDSWNPAIISDYMKLISYIRNISDTWNPSQLNEALKLLGFRTVDTWNPAQLEETKNNLVQYFLPKIATGNPIELNLTGNLPYTVESAKVTMLPIQDLHGYDSPWVGGAGKNKADETAIRSKFLLDAPLITNTEITASVKATSDTTNIIMRAYNADGSRTDYWSLYQETGGRYYRTFTLPFDVYKVFFNANGTISECQLELGNQLTSYAPYSNICPISGRDSVDLVVSDGESEVKTYTATFPATVYGGSYEFVGGKLSDEWVEIEEYNGETLPGEWISDRDAYAEGTTPTIGAQVVYKTTATETTLTPQAISLNKGENVINSDADNIELNYKINLN